MTSSQDSVLSTSPSASFLLPVPDEKLSVDPALASFCAAEELARGSEADSALATFESEHFQ